MARKVQTDDYGLMSGIRKRTPGRLRTRKYKSVKPGVGTAADFQFEETHLRSRGYLEEEKHRLGTGFSFIKVGEVYGVEIDKAMYRIAPEKSWWRLDVKHGHFPWEAVTSTHYRSPEEAAKDLKKAIKKKAKEKTKKKEQDAEAERLTYANRINRVKGY